MNPRTLIGYFLGIRKDPCFRLRVAGAETNGTEQCFGLTNPVFPFMIQHKQVNRRLASSRDSDNVEAIPSEIISPFVCTRIE
jgi:hypothetical protein